MTGKAKPIPEYPDILTNAPIGFFICSPEGELLAVNPHMASMFGYETPLEMIASVSHLTDSETFQQLINTIGKAFEYELPYRDGGKFIASVTVAAVKEKNSVTQYHGFITDIAEQKKNEEALYKKDFEHQQIIEKFPIPTFVIDKDHRVTHWNQALEKMSGIKAKKMIGTTYHWKAFYEEERPCPVDFLVDQSLDALAYWYAEENIHPGPSEDTYEATGFFPALGKKGKWVHFTAATIKDSDGKVVGAMESLEDLTDLKQAKKEHEKLQNQLLVTQKMDSVGILAGGVAHEFNNLFQILRGNIEILDMDKPEGHPDKPRLKTIEKHIKVGSQLIRQLMLFSRREPPRRQLVDLNHQVRETVSFLEKTLLKRSKIELRLTNIWQIYSDPHQVEQVLFNLCTNAAEAMPQGGKVTIDTRNVTLSAGNMKGLNLEPGRYVLMTVTDTGSGMDNETLKHIFEPFFTTRGVGKGTGLGLASVYGIIEAHGGLITCHSELGKGTTFYIYWPAIADS